MFRWCLSQLEECGRLKKIVQRTRHELERAGITHAAACCGVFG